MRRIYSLKLVFCLSFAFAPSLFAAPMDAGSWGGNSVNTISSLKRFWSELSRFLPVEARLSQALDTQSIHGYGRDPKGRPVEFWFNVSPEFKTLTVTVSDLETRRPKSVVVHELNDELRVEQSGSQNILILRDRVWPQRERLILRMQGTTGFDFEVRPSGFFPWVKSWVASGNPCSVVIAEMGKRPSVPSRSATSIFFTAGQ